MRLLFLAGILILNIAALCAEETFDQKLSDSVYPAGPYTIRTSIKRIIDGTARFSSQFIQQVASKDENNLVLSPLGAALALALTSFGARGMTSIVLSHALGLDNSVYRRKIGYQSVVDYLNSFKAVELQIASAVFLGAGREFNPDFVESSVRAFRSRVAQVDFSQSQQADDLINKWCANQTRGRIESIVNPGDLNENTALVIVNALYFKGTWLNKFNAEYTGEGPFFLKNGKIKQMPMMSAINVVRHGESEKLDAKYLELPYISHDPVHNASMIILLPRDRKDLSVVEANLPKLDVAELLKTGTVEKVNIQLPKFKIESELNLEEPLKRMGMGNLFDPHRGNFGGIIKPSPAVDQNLQPLRSDYEYVRPSELVIDKIIQKASIEVNEEGSEAAAATAELFGFRSGAAPNEPIFWADHPFIAILTTTGPKPIILFAARYTGLE